MTPLVCKSFENANRKQNICRACVVFLFVWINCEFLCKNERLKKQRKARTRKNKEGDVGLGYFQALWEERMRGGGGWGKVRTLLNRFTNGRKPLSPSRWQRSQPLPAHCDKSVTPILSGRLNQSLWLLLFSLLTSATGTRLILLIGSLNFYTFWNKSRDSPTFMWFPGCLDRIVLFVEWSSPSRVWSDAMLWLQIPALVPKCWWLVQQ